MGVGVYRILVNGLDVTEKWRREKRVLEITVDDHEGESSDACTILLDDQVPHIEWPPEGATLRLWMGNTVEDVVDMGLFTLDAPAASGPPDRLRVQGHAATYVAAGANVPLQSHRTRTWTAVTLADMAASIAQEHGLVARVKLAVGAELIEACEQVNESDIAFLSRIAKERQARVRVKSSSTIPSGVLEVVGAGPSLPQVVLARADVEEWSAPFGSANKPGQVIASWHNPKTGGSGVVHAGSGEPRLILTEIFDNAQSAQSACKSRHKDKSRETAKLELELTTLNTAVAAGTLIALSGFRSEISTLWNVVHARHHLDGRRARTSITAEKAEEL